LLVGHVGGSALEILDISDPSSPRERGRLPVGGDACSVTLVDDVAVIVLERADRWTFDGSEVIHTGGARLAAVDVADPDHPKLVLERPIAGPCLGAARRGHILHVVSVVSWGGTVRVEAFDVSDARRPISVDAVDVRLEPSLYVRPLPLFSGDRLTIAMGDRLVAIDLSDAGGRLSVGATVVVDDWVTTWVDGCVDFDAASGALRAVLFRGRRSMPEEIPLWSGFGAVVIDWSDHRSATVRGRPALFGREDPYLVEGPLGEVEVTACRFANERLYLATRHPVDPRGDPLLVFDVADPRGPVLVGAVHFAEWLNHLEARGDRVLGVGTANEDGLRRPVLMSFDVADPAAPTVVSRTTSGPGALYWTIGPVLADGRALAAAFRGRGGHFVEGVLVAAIEREPVERPGFVAHAGELALLRPRPDGPLVAISGEAMQIVDVGAEPVTKAELSFARGALATAVTPRGTVVAVVPRPNGNALVVASGEPFRVRPSGARAPVPIEGETPSLVTSGEVIWVLTTTPPGGATPGATTLLAVDFADPVAPRPRGRLALPSDAAIPGFPEPRARRPWHLRAARIGDALVAPRVVRAEGEGARRRYERELLIVDLSDPDAPRLSHTLPLGLDRGAGHLVVSGSAAWLPRHDAAGATDEAVRFTAVRVDLANVRAPIVHPPVNVPGELFALSDDGSTIYTEEQRPSPAFGSSEATLLHALALPGDGTAELRGSAELPGTFVRALARGGFAYVGRYDPERVPGAGPAGRAALATVRLADMAVTSLTAIPAIHAFPLATTEDLLLVTADAGYDAQPPLLAFSLREPSRPHVERAFVLRQPAARNDVALAPACHAYVAAGMAGVIAHACGASAE
jgi:hypothetical protein